MPSESYSTENTNRSFSLSSKLLVIWLRAGVDDCFVASSSDVPKKAYVCPFQQKIRQDSDVSLEYDAGITHFNISENFLWLAS